VVYGARPEYCALSADAAPGAVQGTVSIVENLGTTALVTVDAGGRLLQATVPDGEEPPVGSPVWLAPLPDRALLYDEDTGELLSGDATVAARVHP